MRQTQLPKGQEDGGERIQTLWYFLIEMQNNYYKPHFKHVMGNKNDNSG